MLLLLLSHCCHIDIVANVKGLLLPDSLHSCDTVVVVIAMSDDCYCCDINDIAVTLLLLSLPCQMTVTVVTSLT